MARRRKTQRRQRRMGGSAPIPDSIAPTSAVNATTDVTYRAPPAMPATPVNQNPVNPIISPIPTTGNFDLGFSQSPPVVNDMQRQPTPVSEIRGLRLFDDDTPVQGGGPKRTLTGEIKMPESPIAPLSDISPITSSPPLGTSNASSPLSSSFLGQLGNMNMGDGAHDLSADIDLSDLAEFGTPSLDPQPPSFGSLPPSEDISVLQSPPEQPPTIQPQNLFPSTPPAKGGRRRRTQRRRRRNRRHRRSYRRRITGGQVLLGPAQMLTGH